MELKDFVRVTIEQIVEGTALAQEAVKAKGGIVNPSNMTFQRDGQLTHSEHALPQHVVFDVGLTSTDKSGSSEGIGVFLGSINLGKRNDTGNEHVAVTRVQFTVPLALPPGSDLTKRY